MQVTPSDRASGVARSPRSSGRRSTTIPLAAGSVLVAAGSHRSAGRSVRALRTSPFAAARRHRRSRLYHVRTADSVRFGMTSATLPNDGGGLAAVACGVGGVVAAAEFSSGNARLQSSASLASRCLPTLYVGRKGTRGALSSSSFSPCGSDEPTLRLRLGIVPYDAGCVSTAAMKTNAPACAARDGAERRGVVANVAALARAALSRGTAACVGRNSVVVAASASWRMEEIEIGGGANAAAASRRQPLAGS